MCWWKLVERASQASWLLDINGVRELTCDCLVSLGGWLVYGGGLDWVPLLLPAKSVSTNRRALVWKWEVSEKCKENNR
eukprot:1391450-Amorphochlora_amoeboformis.AAC.1